MRTCETGGLERLGRDRPREQDVVLQMDVLVQIDLHALQFLVHRPEGWGKRPWEVRSHG